MFESLVEAVAAYRTADTDRWAAVRAETAALERTHAVIEVLRAGGHLELIRLLAMESATEGSPQAHARYASAHRPAGRCRRSRTRGSRDGRASARPASHDAPTGTGGSVLRAAPGS